jgi:hypothetical protein
MQYLFSPETLRQLCSNTLTHSEMPMYMSCPSEKEETKIWHLKWVRWLQSDVYDPSWIEWRQSFYILLLAEWNNWRSIVITNLLALMPNRLTNGIAWLPVPNKVSTFCMLFNSRSGLYRIWSPRYFSAPNLASWNVIFNPRMQSNQCKSMTRNKSKKNKINLRVFLLEKSRPVKEVLRPY